MNTLKKLRKHIDHVDHSLLDLLTRRARLVKQIGAIKEKTANPFSRPSVSARFWPTSKAKNRGRFVR